MEQCYYIGISIVSQWICLIFAKYTKMEQDDLREDDGICMVILLKKSCRRDILNKTDIVKYGSNFGKAIVLWPIQSTQLDIQAFL